LFENYDCEVGTRPSIVTLSAVAAITHRRATGILLSKNAMSNEVG
jgi:hypothetical protein